MDDFDINDVIRRIKVQLSFDEFFILIMDIAICGDHPPYGELFEFINEFYDTYNPHALIYLKTLITTEKLWWTHNKSNTIKESDMQNDIIDHFNDYFPNYRFVQKEYPLPSIGRIDILAQDSISGRDVIMELKVGHKNPTQQLLSYGTQFNNPILIGITEELLPTRLTNSDIIYLIYDDLRNGRYKHK